MHARRTLNLIDLRYVPEIEFCDFHGDNWRHRSKFDNGNRLAIISTSCMSQSILRSSNLTGLVRISRLA